MSRSLAGCRVDVAVSGGDFSSSPVQVLAASRTSGANAREQTEVTSSGANGVRGPHDDLLGACLRSGDNGGVSSARGSLVEGPTKVSRTAQVISNHVHKGVDGHEHISDVEAGSEAVASTGQDTQVLLAAEVFEEEVDRVGLEELVLRGSDDVSGLGSESAVVDDGINQSSQGVELRQVEVVQATGKELEKKGKLWI